MSTGCTGTGFTDHDYSQPPHNTPGTPRVPDYLPGQCQSGAGMETAASIVPCEHDRRYEIVVYSVGTHDWVRMQACAPCTAAMRIRHEHAGPDSANGIRGIREVAPDASPAGP